MPEEDKNTSIPRSRAAPLLVRQFIQEYKDTIKDFDLPQQLEFTEHFVAMLNLVLEHASSHDEEIYEQYLLLEDGLLKKYKKTFRPYLRQRFYLYFDLNSVLKEKNIYPPEQFECLSNDEQCLSLEEATQFACKCTDIMYHARMMIYLQMEPETASPATKPVIISPDETDKEATRARQLLAIYYLLKAGWGVEPRSTHAISIPVRFVHLLTGTKFKTLGNSEIYKKYCRMPNYNSGERLISDLKFIRPSFEQLHIHQAIKWIDEEMQRAVSDLPAIERTKYLPQE